MGHKYQILIQYYGPIKLLYSNYLPYVQPGEFTQGVHNSDCYELSAIGHSVYYYTMWHCY